MHTVYPPLRDTGAPAIPFAVGAQAFQVGVGLDANPYPAGTVPSLRFTAGWEAARSVAASSQACRVCGCTDDDCTGCIARTGQPCHWVDADLCSACFDVPAGRSFDFAAVAEAAVSGGAGV